MNEYNISIWFHILMLFIWKLLYLQIWLYTQRIFTDLDLPYHAIERLACNQTAEQFATSQVGCVLKYHLR